MDYTQLTTLSSNISELNANANANAKRGAHEFQIHLHTFGCKVNTYDSGLIQKNLKTKGYDVVETQANSTESLTAVHVLNTCAVTAEATKQSLRLIRKIKRQNPLATVVVTGCSAQVDKGAFDSLASVDLVVANSHKGLLPQLLEDFFKNKLNEKVFKSNIFKKDELEAGGGVEASHTRNFLKIQDGCNSFCTFCIIPFARGKSRSIPVDNLVSKINEFVDSGASEVVLTGVHIGDYEDSTQNKKLVLEDLVESVLKRTRIKRIRLSSLEPIEISDRLLDLYSDSRLCPHFHMSIQSADTGVLANMKRKYKEEDVRKSLLRIEAKVKNAFVGMDVIAGFPTESKEEFENTYKILSELPWTQLHVFPYSERAGTKATLLAQIPFSERKERAAMLRALSLHRHQAEALKQVGHLKKVLVLNNGQAAKQGLSRDYWNINLNLGSDSAEKYRNQEVVARVNSLDLKSEMPILNASLVEV